MRDATQRLLALTLALAAVPASLAALEPCAPGPACPPGPAFELLPLGVMGGERDGDLSSFAVRAAGEEGWKVVLDGGSMQQGIAEHLDDDRYPELQRFYLGLDHVFFTHSHLDHTAGWIMLSPMWFQASTPARVHGLPATIDALRTHVFQSPLWGDFEAAGKVELVPLEPGDEVAVRGLTLSPMRLDHTVPAAGWLVRDRHGAAFAHLGDTGPTRRYMARVRPLLEAGQLRALALECSFPDALHELALTTGHLTPDLIRRHLVELALGEAPPQDQPVPAPQIQAAAHALRTTLVLLHHLKPGGAAAIRREVQGLRRDGFRVVFPRRARRLSF